MSLDLDWTLLDSSLSSRLLSTINRALESSDSKRPSFLGEICITSLEFGSHPPDLTIRHVGDVWSDFITHDDLPPSSSSSGGGGGGSDLPVPPMRTRRGQDTARPPQPPPPLDSPEEGAEMRSYAPDFVSPGSLPLRSYVQFNDTLPPHRIQGPPSVFSPSLVSGVGGGSTPGPLLFSPRINQQHQQWSAALASRGIRAAGTSTRAPSPSEQHSQPLPSPGYFGHWQGGRGGGGGSRKSSCDAASSSVVGRGGPGPMSSVSNVVPRPHAGHAERGRASYGAASARTHPGAHFGGAISSPFTRGQHNIDDPSTTPCSSSSAAATTLPSLQLHFHLHWPTATFRLTIQTSLLINYPSPAFMSLPLQLSVTGFVLRCGLILSLEGERRRAHICLTEASADEDEEGSVGLSSEDLIECGGAAAAGRAARWTRKTTYGFDTTRSTTATATATGARKVTPGQSILPSLTFESEVGQSDKHALKNVGKVEKFVAEVLRKGIEDELVFPNYYTLDLPPPSK